MKKLLLLLLLLFVAPAQATVTLPFSTTYNCAEQNQLSPGWVNCDGISASGAWNLNPYYEQITTPANYSGGAGGRGQRHWIGNGKNVNTGSVAYSFTSQSELWIRFYVRWQPGYIMTGNGQKLLYFHPFYFLLASSDMRFSNGNNWTSNFGWNSMYPSGSHQSDGAWHWFEVHVINNGPTNGVGQVWVDGNLVFNRSDIPFNGNFNFFEFPENAEADTTNCVGNGGNCFNDYDDVAIRTTGPIGPVPVITGDRYVKTSCTNAISTYSPGADTCTGGSSLVYSSIANAITAAAAGDQIYIRAGTYATNFTTAQLAAKSSTAYATALTIQAYQSEVVTIKPTAGNACMALGTSGGLTLRYVIFKNLVCDGSNNGATTSDIDGVDIGGGGNGGAINHIKFDGVEVKNWSGNGLVTADDGNGDSLWLTGVVTHDGGGGINVQADQRHCWYIESSNVLIENSECYNWTNYGVHNYAASTTPSNNTYRSLKIHNTGTDTARASFAIGLYVGSNNLAYNNLIYANQNGVDINGTAQGSFNNTFYLNGVGFGGACCYPAVNAVAGSGHFLQNNLLVSNQVNTVDTTGSSGTTSNHNVTSTTPATVFVNAPANNFQIIAGSPAVGSGADLSVRFTTDYAGNTWTVPWGVSAYQIVTAGGPIVVKLPSSPTGLRLGSGASVNIGLTP